MKIYVQKEEKKKKKKLFQIIDFLFKDNKLNYYPA